MEIISWKPIANIPEQLLEGNNVFVVTKELAGPVVAFYDRGTWLDSYDPKTPLTVLFYAGAVADIPEETRSAVFEAGHRFTGAGRKAMANRIVWAKNAINREGEIAELWELESRAKLIYCLLKRMAMDAKSNVVDFDYGRIVDALQTAGIGINSNKLMTDIGRILSYKLVEPASGIKKLSCLRFTHLDGDGKP